MNLTLQYLIKSKLLYRSTWNRKEKKKNNKKKRAKAEIRNLIDKTVKMKWSMFYNKTFQVRIQDFAKLVRSEIANVLKYTFSNISEDLFGLRRETMYDGKH